MENTAQVRIVRPADRFASCRALIEMHHHRKQVFVDRLGWRVGPSESWLEIDQFDDDHAVYVMVIGEDERHLGSVRLLATTRQHMLGTIFAGFCGKAAPTGPDVWEISRFLATPATAGGVSILRIHRILARALVDFAEANGIRRYTLVAESRRMPALLSVGWTVLPLCLPLTYEGELVEAAEIVLDDSSVSRLRQRTARCAPAEISFLSEIPA